MPLTIDITRPHIGRIYDYVLGGTQNYESDRRAADAMVALMPSYPRWARVNRSFLDHVGKRWAKEGVTRMLDLGSGLPTQGHFNEHLPDAKILFTDFDPLTVAQAQQLLAYSPEMAYANIDLKEPDALIAQAAAYFGAERPIAVGAIGVVYFLDDAELQRLMQGLHAFSSPGTKLALSFHYMPPGCDTAAIDRVIAEGQKRAQINFYLRTPERMSELIRPWRLTEHRPIQDWLGQETPVAAPPVAGVEDPLQQLTLVGAFAEH